MAYVFKPDTIYRYQEVEIIKVFGSKPIFDNMDPFAQTIIFKIKLPEGFPDHPHKGFQALTYIFNGTLLYQDIHGNRDTLSQGDVQWMTTGKGVIHSEIPASSQEYTYAIQYWINSTKQKLYVDNGIKIKEL